MLLEVRPSNEAAIRLYQRYGFERIGVRRGYYPTEGGREDAIVMRISL
jgi:ribosomal-protein-alanine N-acetyltransferase